MTKPPKVAIVYHYFAHYRQPILDELSLSDRFHYLLASDDGNSSGIKALGADYFNSRTGTALSWTKLKNYWLKPLLWQQGVLKLSLSSQIDAVIFLGDAFFISTWAAAILARLTGKKVFFWTHGLYGRESFLKRLYRVAFYRIANGGLLLYGNHAKQLLASRGFASEKLVNVFNSLDHDLQLSLRKGLDEKSAVETRRKMFGQFSDLPTMVFIGRLTPEKKLELLVKLLVRFHAESKPANLILVGDGGEKHSLQSSIPVELKDHVCFYGACYDEKEIATLIHASNVCVSPGNIGLTAIHSLTYGTPVVTHDDKRWQGPEFEAVEDGINGSLFKREDFQSLKTSVEKWLFNQDAEITFAHCTNAVDRDFNPSNQRKLIEMAIRKALGEQK